MAHEYKFQGYKPESTDLSCFQGLMQSSIGPRPIAFASTIDKEGRPNLSPFSFFNVFGTNPPVLIFSPVRSVRNNATKHTHENVLEVPEVVINVVSYALVQQACDSSANYPKGVNEFEMVGLTMLKSELVKPFRVLESPVQFECKVLQVIETGKEPGAGNLVICEILKMHIREDILDESGNVDPHKMDLVGRIGGNYYVRASGNALFELRKPE